MSTHQYIATQAARVFEMANLNAPPVVIRREMELLQSWIDKLPAPPRLPPRKKKEKWSKL